MTVKVLPEGFALDGDCPLEDAEILLAGLSQRPAAVVDWRSCEGAHTAVVQVLMAWEGPLVGPPAGDFLRHYVGPALDAGRR